MKKIILSLLILTTFYLSFSQKYTISGYVENAESGERLIGASVYDNQDVIKGTVTNVYGFYSLTLPSAKVKLTSSFVGFSGVQTEFYLEKDTVINIALNQNIEIDEIIVSGKKNKVKSTQMSSIEIPIQAIKKLPVLLGETDVLKTIQLMPGVQSGAEGTSGLYVRGGGPDQNLILLDGVPVYNVNHLFGFFSVFNGYAIQDITLIKGGFPARYGGRLSSVLDIRMKEGNMKKFAGEASSSLIASKFVIEGPIIKNKTSFILSARRTYIDIIAAPFILTFTSINPDIEKMWGGYFFHDLNAKINHKFSEKSRLFLSLYTGKDKAYMKIKEDYSNGTSMSKYKTDFDLHWGNFTSALRWNYVFSPKLFGNTTLTYSRYNFVTSIEEEDEHTSWSDPSSSVIYHDNYEIEYLSGIEDFALKFDFDYLPNPNHKIKYGINAVSHTFRPGVSAFRMVEQEYGENIDTTYGSGNIYAQEYTIYFEDDLNVGKKLKFNIGLHASSFNVKDTFFYSLQPRLSSRFLITDNWSVKLAYSEMTQYLHFLTNSRIGLPTDLWLPATDIVPPQKSIQYAAGTVISLPGNIDFTLESFYKEMTNLIEYKEGATFFDEIESSGIAGDNWENKIEIGKGKSYGLEFLLQKNYGKFTGWIGYTLSKTDRQFENISFGKRFPYRYDRKHDGSIVINYKFNEKFDLGLTWVYGTGIAVTLAQQRYIPFNRIQDLIGQLQYDSQYYWVETVEYYGARNNFRLPAYHRLDIAFNFTKEKNRGIRTWSLSIYNTYNRLNPFYVDFSGGIFFDYGEERQLMQYSFFQIMPTISYTYKFK